MIADCALELLEVVLQAADVILDAVLVAFFALPVTANLLHFPFQTLNCLLYLLLLLMIVVVLALAILQISNCPVVALERFAELPHDLLQIFVCNFGLGVWIHATIVQDGRFSSDVNVELGKIGI